MNSYKRFTLFVVPTTTAIILVTIVCLLSVLHFAYSGTALSDKLYLLERSPVLIFAGDSRAHRQLSPLVAAPLLDLPTDKVANIAVTGGNITDLSEVMRRNPNKFKEANVLISLSVLCLNDGVLDNTSVTDSVLSKMSLWEQIYYFLPEHFSTFSRYYKNIIKGGRKRKEADREHNGYLPIDRVFSFDDNWTEGINNYWFQNWNVRGFKYRIMRNELKTVKELAGAVYVYAGPYAPSVLDDIARSKADVLSKKQEFDQTMKQICSELGIPFISYFGDRTFSDEQFYDGVHLNANATSAFTPKIIRDFGLL